MQKWFVSSIGLYDVVVVGRFCIGSRLLMWRLSLHSQNTSHLQRSPPREQYFRPEHLYL